MYSFLKTKTKGSHEPLGAAATVQETPYAQARRLQSLLGPAGHVLSISLRQEAFFFMSDPPLSLPGISHTHTHTQDPVSLLPFQPPNPQELCFGKVGLSQVQSGEEDRGVTWEDSLPGEGGGGSVCLSFKCTHTHTHIHSLLKEQRKLTKCRCSVNGFTRIDFYPLCCAWRRQGPTKEGGGGCVWFHGLSTEKDARVVLHIRRDREHIWSRLKERCCQ